MAIVLFASIGNAFGQSITFDFNGINDNDYNADAFIVNTESWVSSNETINFPEGEDVTIRVYAYGIYKIKSIIIDNINITANYDPNEGYTFSNINADHTVRIVCEKGETQKISLSLSHENVAYVKFECPDFSTYPASSQEVEVPKGGNIKMGLSFWGSAYQLQSIKVDGSDITADFIANGYTFENITANHSVSIVFKPVPSHSVSVNNSGGSLRASYFEDVESGDKYLSNPVQLAAGKNARLYIEPTLGYGIKRVTIYDSQENPTNVTQSFKDNGYYEFVALDDNYDVEIVLQTVTTYTITANYDNTKGGVILDGNWAETGNGKTYNEGSTVRLEVSTYDWIYNLQSITINGIDVTSYYIVNGYYDICNLSENLTVEVTFAEAPTLTAYYDYGMGNVILENIGLLSPNNPHYFESGSTVRMWAYPDDEYKISSIYVGEEDVTSTYMQNGYYDITLNDPISVTVNYVEAAKYDIVVNSDNWHGSYYISEDNPITEGTNVRMEIYPEEGYIATVSENGNVIPFTHFTSCSTGYYGYQFTKLDADHDLDVTFLYTGSANVIVNYTQSHVESVSLNDCWGPSSGVTTMVTAGTTSSIRVNTRIGYEVERVVANGTELTADENGFYMFMVTSNGCTVTVTTKKKTAPAKVAFTLSELGVGTYFSEYDLNFSAISGIKVYVASGFNPSTNDLVLTRVHEVPAGTGLMVKGTPGNYEIPTCDTRYIYANMLKGVVEETQIWENWMPSWAGYAYYVNYVLDDNGDFNLVADGYELSANSAYLTIPQYYIENSSAKIHTIFLDDEEEINGITTGVGFIWAGEKRNATATDDVYNLQGQKVNSKTLKPGIYIKNGKKFMVK